MTLSEIKDAYRFSSSGEAKLICELVDEIERLRAMMQSLYRGHVIGCDRDGTCTCGADDHNVLISQILEGKR